MSRRESEGLTTGELRRRVLEQLAEPAERYYVCEHCGHYWLSPAPPHHGRCESCRLEAAVVARDTLEGAEDLSALVRYPRRPA